MHKPNNLLESDVRDELDWDPQIDDSRIVVKAAAGIVTLSGAVGSCYESTCAYEDAWRIGGVKDVENDLLVGPFGEAVLDVDVAAECKAALDKQNQVPKGSVSVDVLDGWVTLRGQVKRHFQRRAAVHAVERVEGVLGVTDKIVEAGDPAPSNVADLINKAFARNAIIDESSIKVSNDGNTVYLDGTVGSWTAMQTAVLTAWDAPGVYKVVNRLEVVS
jgi:osmotically-inducible protein OsmY